MAGWMQTKRGEITHGNLNPTLWHTLANMTSSNLRSGLQRSCGPAPSWPAFVIVFVAFVFCGFGAATACSEEIALLCSDPSVEAGNVIVARCDLPDGRSGGGWRAKFDGQERVCTGVSPAATLSSGAGVQCGEVGGGVWFWQRLEAPARGSLRYRSWAREGAWRVEGSAMLPEQLMVGSSVVSWGQWIGGVSMPYATFRERVWLGGEVSSTLEGSVTVVAERGVAGFVSPVLTELRRLRKHGFGETVDEVQLLAAARDDYASGRSGTGWLTFEFGARASAERVAEVVRHEVAHHLVGGAVRFVRSGRDVGWFLEGFAEYLGFSMAREDVSGRAALFRRFGEASEAASHRQEQLSDYDLGFLYAAAVDGALRRGTSTGLLARLQALVEGRRTPMVFEDREDFLGTEARRDLITELLAGADDAGAERARDWMTREERPDPSILSGDLGVGFAKESMTLQALPFSMHERRDGLFEVTSVAETPGGGRLAISAGDIVWPLAAWSGAGVVALEVSRPYGWQRVTLLSRPVTRVRWRVISVVEAERRWLGGGAGGAPP